MSPLPDLRFVSIGDVSPELGSLAARRFGFERNDTSWQAIAEDPDINVVSVLSWPTSCIARWWRPCRRRQARALRKAAERQSRGRTRDGRPRPQRQHGGPHRFHLSSGAGHSCTPRARHLWHARSHPARRRPLLVRLCERPEGANELAVQGAPGSGALADIGSHVAYLVEFLGGDVQEVSGGRFTTAITERPVPLGTVVGHGQAAVSDAYEPVENDDYATFSARLEKTVGVVQVSRVAAGHPNGLALEVFGENGAAKWEQERSGEFQLMLNEGPSGTRGYRRVIIGPDHPYFAGGLPMDAPGVGVGQNDGFAFQARAF